MCTWISFSTNMSLIPLAREARAINKIARIKLILKRIMKDRLEISKRLIINDFLLKSFIIFPADKRTDPN